MNEVKKFDHELFGQLNVIMYEGTPHFIANEVCTMLGMKNPSQAMKDACVLEEDKVLITNKTPFNGLLDIPTRGVIVITESAVYDLILNSRKPEAKDFKRWVTKEVLPTLRKTGGFVSDVDQIIAIFYKNEAPHIKEVIRSGLNFQKNNQHKIDFADDVADVVNLRSMNDVAKAFGVGRNKMFAKMRDLGILDIKNAPYQTYIDRGYFKVNQVTKHNFLHNVTMVTGKGEVWLHKKLKDEDFLLAA